MGAHSRAYRERTSGMMMLDVERFFRDYLRENEGRYHQFPGVFLHQAISLLPKCQSEEKDDKNLTYLRRLLEEYNLGGWPYRKAPRDADIVTISAFVDRDLGVFPFARVFLRKPFEDDRGYTVHVEAPSLTLKRYNLAYLSEPPENFTRKVALALSLVDSEKDIAERAADIALLENKLHNITTVPRFIEFQDRLKSLSQIDRKGKWNWKQYLTIVFQDIVKFDDNASVAVMSPDYVQELCASCKRDGHGNSVELRGLPPRGAHFPPSSQGCSPLLRLSHDDHLEFTSDRLQACMYMHGASLQARHALLRSDDLQQGEHFTASEALRLQHVEPRGGAEARHHGPPSVLFVVAGTLGDRHRRRQAGEHALRLPGQHRRHKHRRELLQLHRPASGTEPTARELPELQAGTMSVYWQTKPPKEDLDARYDHTALSPGHEYFFARNVLFIPHSNVAFLNDITKSIDPILYPLVLGEILRGMFGAVDRRGATVNHNLALATWWDADEMSKYSQLELCFEEQYYVAIRDLIGDNFETRMRLEENIADNAILGPLHDIYMKVLMSWNFAAGLKLPVDGRQLDMEQLFFILYAVGLCDNPNHKFWKRKLMFGEIPGKLRVNIPLMNFPKFSAAFGCARGFPMNPARKCMIW
ncbi:hypothetical protein HPB48_021120 [Haemaphysalis longicornis]|uniref:Uncharacterized protein n=1 Tax=Haemaphysalis longicornis TaxID=44386 RepID=A0A9J6FS22_HAELO|nr:hypothetical protein HPB48_021120 [Haemaphysalis longicornis]